MFKKLFESGASNSAYGSDNIVAVLDIGTSKMCCLIAKIENDRDLRIVGIGHQAAAGMKNGSIIDLNAASKAIGKAILDAERMAGPHLKGQSLRHITVNVAGYHTLTHHLGVDMKISGHTVTERDIKNALQQGRSVAVHGEDKVLHTLPLEYRIDSTGGILDPMGMNGQHLNARLGVITGLVSALNNIDTAVHANHLDIDHYCAAPYAAGLSALCEDERNLGCTVVDMGGGTTDIGVFLNGKIIYSSAVPAGGIHVTNDIARGLTTSITNAERIKILYGAATTSMSDDATMIDVPFVGESDQTHTHQVPRSLLTGIIQPRIEEIFELVRARLEDSGLQQIAGRRVVLTGGASQLPNLTDIAQLILDKQVRLGTPRPMTGLADATRGPGFATTIGLLHYAAFHAEEVARPTESLLSFAPGSLAQKVTVWLKENW